MWNDPRSLNVLANTLYLAVALALGAAALFWLAQRPVFALHGIVVEGDGEPLQHITPTSVHATVAGRLTGNFFTANLDQVRDVFLTVPWVRQASVRRQWPNALVVTVQEHKALGLWNENRLLNTYGESFTANLGEAGEDGSLPAFAGPEGEEKRVAQRYADLLRWFGPARAEPVRVVLTPRYAWQVALSNGTTLELGRDPASGADTASLEARVLRLAQAMPLIDTRIGRITHADLRYPNGFAIKTERPEPPPGKPKAIPKKPAQKRP